MEFFETVQARRSVRKFKPESIPTSVIEKCLDAGLLAPNSSNVQPWEFYWVKSGEKKSKLVEACFSQSAAATAAELIVAVSRVDTWKRNTDLLLAAMKSSGKIPAAVETYYKKVVPISYFQDPFGILGVLKGLIFTAVGLFRPAPRRPRFRSELFETVTKTTALACENIMLAAKAQGYDTCPMEGFDESRVKSILGLGYKAHVVMIIGIGKGDPAGVFGERYRIPRDLVIKVV